MAGGERIYKGRRRRGAWSAGPTTAQRPSGASKKGAPLITTLFLAHLYLVRHGLWGPARGAGQCWGPRTQLLSFSSPYISSLHLPPPHSPPLSSTSSPSSHLLLFSSLLLPSPFSSITTSSFLLRRHPPPPPPVTPSTTSGHHLRCGWFWPRPRPPAPPRGGRLWPRPRPPRPSSDELRRDPYLDPDLDPAFFFEF